MIESASLHRFQKHTRLEVTFGQITTFCGKTESGKSAIFRALRWLTTNFPSGDGFVGDFGRASSAVVSAVVDGKKITRRRGKGVNSYRLDGKLYKSFGSGNVPRAIENLLRVTKVNFQHQLNLPFLLTESPGQVSKALNQVVNLDVIDDTLKEVASRLRGANSRHEVAKSRLAEAEKEYESTKWSKDAAGEMNALAASIKKHSRNCARIAATRRALEKASEARVRLRDSLGVILAADKLQAFRERADKLAEEQRTLESAVESLKEARQAKKAMERTLRAKELELAKLEKERCPLCGRKKSSSAPSPTCTSHTTRQSPARRSRRGTRPKSEY